MGKVKSCEGCGVCCEGFYVRGVSIVEIVEFERVGNSPEFLEDEAKLSGDLPKGFYYTQKDSSSLDARMVGDCAAYDSLTGRCLRHKDRPGVCRNFKVGSDDCLAMRRSRLKK